jgi:flagellar hook assembly protein FlgD
VTLLTYSNLEGGEIEIFNISGQLVRTFHIDTRKEGKIIWDATDAMGNKVSSGIYFARAKAINNAETIKLLYLK